MTLVPFLTAIEDRIGFKLDEPFEAAYDFIVDDLQTVSIYLDETAGRVRIETHVENSSNRLSQQLLTRLLEFNFPGNATAGATLGTRPDGNALKLINDFDAASIDPRAFADIALAQRRAAIGVTKWIVAQRMQDNG